MSSSSETTTNVRLDGSRPYGEAFCGAAAYPFGWQRGPTLRWACPECDRLAERHDVLVVP